MVFARSRSPQGRKDQWMPRVFALRLSQAPIYGVDPDGWSAHGDCGPHRSRPPLLGMPFARRRLNLPPCRRASRAPPSSLTAVKSPHQSRGPWGRCLAPSLWPACAQPGHR